MPGTGHSDQIDTVAPLRTHGRERQKSQYQSDMIWETLDWPLLAGKMEAGHEPKNVDSLWKLEKARQGILPQSLHKEYSPADILIFA